MRVWRHAVQSQHERIILRSPDTDVYNIGLVMARPGKHFVVQINPPNSTELYVDINQLILSFQHDPDLAPLPQHQLGSIMLQLYAVTGCDYISGMGKATFLQLFFQHAEFINEHPLLETDIDAGFYSCIRLIGTAYFKKNLATMVSKLGFETPNQLYNSLSEKLSFENHHREWYMMIKRAIHIVSEDQRPPMLNANYQYANCTIQCGY